MNNMGIKWLMAFVACLFITNYFHSGSKIDGVIWSDQEGYYIYLPAIFINGGFEDLAYENGCSIVVTPHGQRTFTKYTYGVALLESPFFLAAHVMAPSLGYPRDGRSLPYIWSILVAAIFYMLAGIILISKLLKELNHNSIVSWLVPLGIILGTNAFYYTFREAGMSHIYSFFLFSALIYSSHRKFVSEGFRWSAITAILLALIILIRPTNAIAFFIPLLWGVKAMGILNRFKQFFTNYRWWVIFLLSLSLLFLPQMLYWKSMTGNYLLYSYGNEGFLYWKRPKMWQVLFSPQNGWLIYSPIVVFALAGLGIMLKRKIAGSFLPLFMITLATYIFGSWWAWWFGGAFGHRCFIEYLPLLAVPSAIIVSKIGSSSKWAKLVFGLVVALLVFVNIRMSYIYHGMWDGPNWGWPNYFGKIAEVFFL